VRELLASGIPVDSRTSGGNQTPLHVATGGAVTRLLIGAGADIHAHANHKATPLHMAAEGDSEKVRVLLAAGAHVDARGSCGSRTPLHLAAERCRNREVAQLLIAAGADISAKGHGDWNTTPLQEAFYKYNAGIVYLLLKAGAALPANTPTLHADISTARAAFLLEAGASDTEEHNACHKTTLQSAASRSRHDYRLFFCDLDAISATRMLLEHGARIHETSDNWCLGSR